MIGLTRAVRVFAYSSPIDMRKSYNGLEAIVRLELGHDILAGDLFLFVNKPRNRAKVLFFDGTGLCIFMKRMEKGRFASLWTNQLREPLKITPSELSIYLEGSKLIGKAAIILPDFNKKNLQYQPRYDQKKMC